MKINSINLCFLATLVLLTCCRKVDNDAVPKQNKPEPESMRRYYNFLTQDRRETFLIESTALFWSTTEDMTQTINAFFTDENVDQLKGGTLKFGNHVLNPVEGIGSDGKELYSYCLGCNGSCPRPIWDYHVYPY